MNIERVKAVKALHEKNLLSKANVVGVGVGLRRRGGRVVQDLCIIVSVRQKVPAGQLSPADRIPALIDGVPVDVQVTGTIRAL